MRLIKTLSLGTLLSLAIAGVAQAQSLAVDAAIDSAAPYLTDSAKFFTGDSKESLLGKGDPGKASDAPLPLLGASPLALAVLCVAAYMRRRRRLNAIASAA